jgi:ABC-type molybdate transport system permease subunit
MGVSAAIYLEEYAPKKSRLSQIIQTNIDNLAGVPSIIYGILGLALFVRALDPITSGRIFGAESANGRTILSAGLTMALLVLPIIITNAQESIRAVPNTLRQASYGLGATQWQTIWHHVLPSALPGILTGTILAMSRALGETAPLIIVGAATYITKDTQMLSSTAAERYAAWHSGIVKEAMRYDGMELAPATQRAIDKLKLGISKPAPDDPAKRRELAQIASQLEGDYGAGKYCKPDSDCKSLPELEDILAHSRDYDELLDAWRGWRTISRKMREPYARFVELANEGAVELGYENLGEMWRDGYDMTPAEFETESERLWEQVKPLYDELHCHVRAKLGEVYGADKVPPDAPIPAHLLGNMWSQSWGFIYDIMEPYPDAPDLDVDAVLKAKNYSPQDMVRSAEGFYVSLGMPKLPATFWERSMFAKPGDRDVVCHASAWSMDGADDLHGQGQHARPSGRKGIARNRDIRLEGTRPVCNAARPPHCRHRSCGRRQAVESLCRRLVRGRQG